MLPHTVSRVREHTPRHVNERIDGRLHESLAHYGRHPDRIDGRLAALDREWDIERLLEANAATLSLFGLGLAATVDRRWQLLPVAVAAFLLQHAIQGWCPPVSVFRRMGVRTAQEIDRERYALKALRGDFDRLSSTAEGALTNDANETLRAVET